MCQNYQPHNGCPEDNQQNDELKRIIHEAALKLYLADLRRISALINLHLAIVRTNGGRCYLERFGHPPLRILKPACCHNHWIDMPVVDHGRRKRIRLGPRYVEGLGEGAYFIVGTDGGRAAFEVPNHPHQISRPRTRSKGSASFRKEASLNLLISISPKCRIVYLAKSALFLK